jgi:hypothetical protein
MRPGEPGGFAFHPDLVAGTLRDALLSPAADVGDVEFGQSWHLGQCSRRLLTSAA